MTAAPNHPPLRVWLYTATIIAILLGYLANEERVLALVGLKSGASGEALNVGRLSDAGSHSSRIVALGSSKTLYAIDYDNRFAKRLAGLPHPAIFHRVTLEGANFLDLEAALRILAEHPPDVLLVESDLLLFVRGGRFPIRRDLMPLELRFHAYLSGQENGDVNYAENRGAERFVSAQECTVRTSEHDKLLFAKRVSSARLTSLPSRQKYVDVLRVLQRSGTHVIVTRLPRAPWAEALIPRRAAASHTAALSQLARENGFELWALDSLPREAFCDEGHMTEIGRDLYSRWLSARLLAMKSIGHG